MVADVVLVVTALGVLGAAYGLRQNNLERLRQFEEMYVNRYWSLLDLLSLDALKGSDPKVISNSDERAIRAYIRLCEDELEMRKAGYIGNDTYALWAAGICKQFEQDMFARVWKEVKGEDTFPYDYLTHLKEGPSYEPCQSGSWRRRLRGLAELDGAKVGK